LTHSEQLLHQQINLLMSRLDEQQRRWFAAVEANRLGHGGDERIANITGLDPKTIRRGRQELSDSLNSRPVEKVRLEGAGRPLAEKKTRP
jgi:predicted mannosyl-3-phosphoglycerate phosphatase (HAD superfamily)